MSRLARSLDESTLRRRKNSSPYSALPPKKNHRNQYSMARVLGIHFLVFVASPTLPSTSSSSSGILDPSVQSSGSHGTKHTLLSHWVTPTRTMWIRSIGIYSLLYTPYLDPKKWMAVIDIPLRMPCLWTGWAGWAAEGGGVEHDLEDDIDRYAVGCADKFREES